MADILLVLLIALLLAYFIAEILKYFNVPRVIGQIIAGIILGLPAIKGIFFTNDNLTALSFLSNIGIILLFFFVGLEINLLQFKKNFKESSLIAVFNTLIPLVAGFLSAKYLFKLDNIISLVLGISVSVSAQAISLDILEEMKLIRSRIGNLIVSAGTVDDVFELLLISLILIVFQSAGLSSTNLQKFLLDIVGFVLIIIIFRISIIPFALRIFEKEKSQPNLFMGALIIVLLMASLSELFGIGSLIGSLVAGILVRQTLIAGEDGKPWQRNNLSHSIHIVSFGFLIPVFFVNVGLNTNINTLSSNLFLVFVLLVINVIGTLAGTVIGVILSKGTFQDGVIIGWGVLPKGDTELVIATIALNSGLIGVDIFTVIITVALITTFSAPIIFKLLVKKHAELIKTAKTSNRDAKLV